jgi:hypothetical protein
VGGDALKARASGRRLRKHSSAPRSRRGGSLNRLERRRLHATPAAEPLQTLLDGGEEGFDLVSFRQRRSGVPGQGIKGATRRWVGRYWSHRSRASSLTRHAEHSRWQRQAATFSGGAATTLPGTSRRRVIETGRRLARHGAGLLVLRSGGGARWMVLQAWWACRACELHPDGLRAPPRITGHAGVNMLQGPRRP